MKSLVLISCLCALSAGLLSSCQKDYTCVCTLNEEVVWRGNMGKQRRADARDACEAKTVTWGLTAKCELD